MYQSPSKRLTDLLSAYLDFDQNQLHLGLWRGDLEIQNVNLKNDAFSHILNTTWKQQQQQQQRNDCTSPEHNDDDTEENRTKNTKSSKQRLRNNNRNKESTNNILLNPPSISSFLTKDLLLSSNPSRLSHLDIKLINGSIRFFRAVVPWKSILLGSRDSKVKIELKGVTIRLGLESCIAKAMETDDHGLYGVCKSTRNSNNDAYGSSNHQFGRFYTKDEVEHEQFRSWKQSVIHNAEKNLEHDQEIPISIFENDMNPNDESSEKTSRKKDDNHNTNSHAQQQPNEENGLDANNAIEDASSTFIERFVRSFASNLGWRVGKSFEAQVEDLKIILVHDDIEIGYINKSISIYEFDGVHQQQRGCSNNSSTNSNEKQQQFEDYDEAVVKSGHNGIHDNNNDIRAVKRNKSNELGPNDKNAGDVATMTTTIPTIEDSIIRKSIKIIGSGIFVRKAHPVINDSQRNYRNDPPCRDDHILLPTDIGIVMTLRRDGTSTDIKVEKEDAQPTANRSTSDGNDNDYHQKVVHQSDSGETNEIANTTHQKKRRRGKRDKGHDVNSTIDIDKTLSFHNASLCDESHLSDKSDYVTVDSRQRELFGNSFDRMAFDDPWSAQPSSCEDESSPQFSIQVAISAVTFVFSTQSCLLLNNFSTKVSQLLIGKPQSQIPVIGSKNSADAFIDSETQESFQSLEGGKIIVGQWWSYILFNVLKDLKTKKYRIEELGPHREKFSWLKHKKLKTEYVSLYVRFLLQKNAIKDDIGSKFEFKFGKEEEEKLLKLEDKLSIEQVLLFRSHSRTINTDDALKYMAFESIPSSLLHPLKSSSQETSVSFNQPEIQNVPQVPQNSHRRHKSLFTMENTDMNMDSKHRRGMTLTYDSIVTSGKPGQKEIQEMNFGLHISSTSAQTLQHTNIFSPMDEEENFDQAFQGNISSLVTVSMKSVNLFVCESARKKSNSSRCCGDGDDISALTSNSTDNSQGKESVTLQDISAYSIERDSNIIAIHGNPHEVILSSVVHQTKIHWETKSNRNIQVIGIEGFCCHLVGSSFISSGTLRCLKAGFAREGKNQNSLLSVDSLPHYPFYIKDNTKDNFLCCELQTSKETPSKSNRKGQESVRLQTLIAKIHVEIACDKVSRFLEFIRQAGFVNRPQICKFPSSQSDDARQYVLGQRKSIKSALDKATEVNFFWELNGIEVTLFTKKDFCSQPSVNQQQSTMNTSRSCNTSLVVNKITLRQGSFLNKADTLSRFFKTFPRSRYINTFCTLSKIKILASSKIVLHEVQGVDILCSESKRFGVPIRSDACKVTTSINISATKLRLSKERIQVITAVVERIQEAIDAGNIMGESICKVDYPRINDQTGLCLQKLRVSCPLIDVVIEDDEPYDHDHKMFFEEILFNLLQYEALFGNDVEQYKTRVASQNIAINRLKGLGIQHQEAKAIVDSSITQFNKVVNDDATSLRIERWQDALSGLICKLYDDSIAQSDKGESSLVSCSLGVGFYLEELVYDWRVSIAISPLSIRNANGVCLLQMTHSIANPDDQSPIGIDEAAMSINLMKNEIGSVYGEGGFPLSIYADDFQLETSVANTKYESQAFFSIGQCELLCLDEELLQVMRIVTQVFGAESKDHIQNKGHEYKEPLTSTTISGEITSLNILFCTNEYKPFMEVSLGLVTIDINSNSILYSEGKSFLLTASSKVANMMDLSFEGRTYDQVMMNEDDKSICESFGLKLAVPIDASKFPSELLVNCDSIRLIVLRRFLNDLLQYILTPDYGLGRILNEVFGSEENEETQHPLWFQFHFNHCSFILPRHSNSSDVVAFTAGKVILANGFEDSSWSYPTVYLDEKDCDTETGEQARASNGLHYCNSSYSTVHEENAFDTSLIFRMIVSATDVNIFTGVSKDRLANEINHARNFCTIKSYLEFNEVVEGCKVFAMNDGKMGYPELDRLCERVWEKVTLTPFSFEVISDFLPSTLRVLINDSNSSNGLGLDLRMSQFYAILSTWYENMQELPVLFPYSATLIENNVTIPNVDPNWPEYGTSAFVRRMINPNGISFEIAVCFSEINWCCRFDNPRFFPKKVKSSSIMDFDTDSLILRLKNFIVQVDFDVDNVMRTGMGATSFTVTDKRKSQTIFENAFEVNPCKSYTDKPRSVNMVWGLHCGKAISSDELDFPFQVSVLMTPDRWCLVNLGIEELDTCSLDIAFIWILLDYFSSYYVDENFGNPYFFEKELSDGILRETLEVEVKDEEPLNIDFRLWLLKPCIRIISNPSDLTTPAFVLKSAENGLFYRYKTIGLDFVSQEIYAKNMDMMRLKRSDVSGMRLRQMYTSGNWITMLVRSLHLDIIYDYNIRSNHTDIHVHLGQSLECDETNEGIEFPQKKVLPIQIPLPKICKPSVTPSHELGPISCEIDFMSPEYFKMAFQSIYKFTGPSLEEDSDADKLPKESDNLERDGADEASFSTFVEISGLKVFISDPLLGVHMPILLVNIPTLNVNCSQLWSVERAVERVENGNNNPSDLQACIDAHLWVEYYKSGPTRSWEPLMEPYQCKVLFEKSTRRGQGITISSECPLHLNFSGAFLETLAFAAQSFAPFFYRLGIEGKQKVNKKTTKEQESQFRNTGIDGMECVVDTGNGKVVVKELYKEMNIHHEKIPMMNQDESAVFSLTNLTGDQIRYHQQLSHDSAKLINYLQHKGSVALDFPATRSLVMNLKIVEIPVFKNGEQIYNDTSSGRLDSSNYIDLQIPGFNWSRSIPVDVTGKRFVGLQPKSLTLQTKIANDWRLANALSILTDVSFYEGKRQVTVTSSFELLNKTTHEIQLASHINPMHMMNNNLTNKSPKNEFTDAVDETLKMRDCSLQVINPGETVQVPILLLESSLQQDGYNLGSFWLRPRDQDRRTFISSLDIPGLKADEASIGFCSNPMHIARIVDESAVMFRKEGGNIVGSESFSSGYQLSCPIVEKEEENISPFCYCIEVKRSPLVAPFVGHDCSSSHWYNKQENEKHSSDERDVPPIEEGQNEEASFKASVTSNNAEMDIIVQKPSTPDTDVASAMHGPVAYSLEIHPPMVIENFLPENARFELMHATRRKIVWSTELSPGESIPVYTVGLDAPLLLLIHLGYCRTPVGEGALVHHGSSDMVQEEAMMDADFNSDTFIHTFTKLQMTKSARAGMRIGKIHESDKPGRRKVDNKRVRDGKRDGGPTNDPNQPFYQVYSIHDIATETTLVDHLGQKINLYIENELGGGGQRRITIYCPYWIVNTTDHALRYKQDKVSSFVSGTLTKDSKDGSRIVDLRGSTVGDLPKNPTIFPGKPGALSRNNLTVDEFAKLMEKEMPLQDIASMAFMFNFRDYLSIGGYERKLCIQLADPTGGSKYCSDWSNGVSLESVGVSQTISMHCMDGRHLEIVMSTRVAPGRLSSYTKIVRLSPKYVLVNQLERPIRLWQDSSLMHPSRTLDGFKNSTNNREPHHWRETSRDKMTGEENISTDVVRKYDFLFGCVAQLDYRKGTKMRHGTVADKAALYITTAGKGELIPFHLPDTKVDRELRIDLGRKWNLTASFPSDIICDYTFKLNAVVDLRILKHVDNRASARYVVRLPPQEGFDQNNLQSWDGELGLWFETIQWSHGSKVGTKIVVKGTKRGKYSINNTDIHAGDELLQIDDTPVSEMTFSDTMKVLKERLSEVLDTYRSAQLQSVQNAKKNGAPRTKKPKFLQRFERSASGSTVQSDTTPDDEPKGREELTLVFQTLEHRMRKLRGKALGRRNIRTRMRGSSNASSRMRSDSGNHKELKANTDSTRSIARRQKGEDDDTKQNEEVIQVSMKHLNQSIFVFVHKVNLSIPYKIENRSLDYVLYFRQRGCEHHQWNVLLPGDSLDYSWEEPMKPQKLHIRVGARNHRNLTKDNPRRVTHALPFNIIDSEDHAGFGTSRTLKLDEIGYVNSLPCPVLSNGARNQQDVGFSFLHCQISAEGKTKKLVVSDNQNSSVSEELIQLESHMDNLTRQISEEKQKHENLLSLKCIALPIPPPANECNEENNESGDSNYNQRSLPTVKEEEIVSQINESKSFVDDSETRANADHNIEKAIIDTADYGDDDIITSRHQVLVEIVEGSGLRQPISDAGRSCNPYCTVRVIRRNKKHRANAFALKSDNVKRTYYINQNESPKWSGMKFIFDVSPEAALDPQGFSIIVKVKDFKLMGKNGSLGMTEIRLHNLKHQKEVFGWYPLMARTGRGSESLAASAEGGRGSVKLRVQWIYSVSSLLDYYLHLSQKRLVELSTHCEGMKRQLENLKEDEEKEKEMRYILNKSSISIINTKAKKMLHTSAARSTSKQGRTSKRWNRQKDPVNDLSLHSDGQVQLSGSCVENLPSRTDVSKVEPNSHLIRDVEDSSFDSKEVGGFQLSISHEDSTRGELSRISDIHSSSLPASISSMKSWLQASILLNLNSVRQLYDCSQKRPRRKKSRKRFARRLKTCPYPALVLPTTAPKTVQVRKRDFLDALHLSRENFEKAAQRSLRSVSNPGGWLRIRPITALYLPSNGYTGMYVKLRYGSESIVSRTVPTPVNPEWSSESSQHEDITELLRTKRQSNGLKIGTPSANEGRNLFDLGSDESFYFSEKNKEENDLEINVQALRTDGSLRLSVIGVKVNSKEELGVLHIPLADAICCCTEKFDDEDNEGNKYERWFPLTDPKWTDSVDVNVSDSHRSALTEEIHSDVFSMNYTKCIKLAMWWEKDEKNTLHIANPINEINKSRNFTQSYFDASLNGISAAIIDSFKAKELLSLDFTNIDVRALVTKPKTWLGFALGNIQIDHHHEDALEAVVLGPTPVMHPQPTIQFLAERDNIKSKSNIDSFRHIAIQLEELDLRIEENWVYDLWDMYAHLIKKYHAMQKSISRAKAGNLDEYVEKAKFGGGFIDPEYMGEVEKALVQTQRDKQAFEAEDKVAKKIYIDELMLGSVKLNISYIKRLRNKSGAAAHNHYHGKKSKSITDYRRAEIFRLWSELGHDEDWTARSVRKSRSFPEVVSAVFPAISAAPVRVSGKALNNVFETWSELIVTLKNFYSKEIIYQCYNIIGALDIVGNPIMHVNSLLKGARDFVVIPYQEFLRSPKNPSRLGIGFAKGTLSLFSHFFSGVFGYLSSFSGKIGTGVATLSLDEYFKRWHAEQAADQLRHRNLRGHRKTHVVVTSIARPIQDIIVGVYFATSGIIVEPYIGARTDGFNGLSRGLMIGTLGIVTKPIVGIFDAISHFCGTVNDVARSINIFDKKLKPVSKRRYPYTFGCNNILQPYDAIDARSANLLDLFPFDSNGSDDNGELLVMSEMLLLYPGEATYIVVTTRRIVLFEVQIHGRAPPIRVWQNDFEEDVEIISSVENFRHSGYVLRIKRVPTSVGKQVENQEKSEALVEVPTSETPPNKNVNKRQETNIKAIYEQAGALLPNVAFNSKPDYRNPVDVAVLGEFAHSKELTRVHNAICCLTEQFDSIIRNTNNTNNTKEGYTSFKSMHFVDESMSEQRFHKMDEESRDTLFQHLDHIPWVHFETMNDTTDTEATRRAWDYSKELEVSKMKGGPLWVIESRARSSFIPMEFPPIPKRLGLGFNHSPDLQQLRDKLQKGELSLNEVETEFRRIISREDDLFASARSDFLPTLKDDELNPFKIEEIEEIGDGDDDKDRSLQSFESNHDSFVKVPVSLESSIENIGMETLTTVKKDQFFFEEINQPRPIPPKPTESNSSEQRLAHVEHMLQKLMSQMTEKRTNNQESNVSFTQAPPMSTISALTNSDNVVTNSDNVVDGKDVVKQHDSLPEREQLLQEIDNLKKQLAYAQQNPPNYINALNETTSTSTGVLRQKRKKKRRRKLIKNPWK